MRQGLQINQLSLGMNSSVYSVTGAVLGLRSEPYNLEGSDCTPESSLPPKTVLPKVSNAYGKQLRPQQRRGVRPRAEASGRANECTAAVESCRDSRGARRHGNWRFPTRRDRTTTVVKRRETDENQGTPSGEKESGSQVFACQRPLNDIEWVT